MESIEVMVLVRRNGYLVENVTRRIEVPEVQTFNYNEAADADATTFSSLPISVLATLKALFVRTNKAVTIRLDGQTDAGIDLNPGGLLLILDGAVVGATINNPATAEAAVIEGIGVGE